MPFTAFPIPTNSFTSYAGSLTGSLTWGAIQKAPCFELSSNISFAGTAQDDTQSWVFLNGLTMSGTAKQGGTSGVISPLQFYIGSDSVDTTTSGNGTLVALNVLDAPAAAHTGTRVAVQGAIAVVGSPTGNAGAYVGLGSFARCQVNLGGVTTNYSTYAGGLFGENPKSWAQNGATALGLVNGSEIDVEVDSGATCAEKHALTLVKVGNDAVRAAFDDAAISINDQDSTSITWQYGIEFGAYGHKWPFGTDSTLIFAQSRQVGPASTSVANYGVDFTNVTFTTGGAGFLAPLITPASSSATGKQGSIVWDANFIYVCTATNTWKRVAIATW